MKILFIIKTLDHVKGGAERVLAEVTSGLAEKGHDVYILTFDAPGGTSVYPLHKSIKRVSLPVGNALEKTSLKEAALRVKAIREISLKLEPDVVVPFMHSSFIPASFALIGTKIPVVASEHIVPQHYKSFFGEYLLLKISMLIVDKITVLSEPIIRTYPSYLHKKMVAITNPVRHPSNEPSVKKENIILNVGRLTEQKDQKTLISAFANIADRAKGWKVRIIGDGPLHGELEKQIADLGMQDKINLAGTTDAIEQEYKSAKIFALPSIYESFGLATAEAMACGLPVIGFAECPGTNEIIDDGYNGILVKGSQKRIQNMEHALLELINDENKRKDLGANAQKHVKKFHPKNVVKQWEDLLKETILNKNR